MEKERRWQIDRCLLLLSAERNSERGESSHLHLHLHLHPKTRQRQRLVEILVPIMTLKRCSFFVIWIFLFVGRWSRWSEERLAINYNRDRGGVEPPELQLNHQSTWNLQPATCNFHWPSAASSNCRCFCSCASILFVALTQLEPYELWLHRGVIWDGGSIGFMWLLQKKME